MLTYISFLMALGSWYSQLYEPVPMRDTYERARKQEAEREKLIETIRKQLNADWADSGIIRSYLAMKAYDDLINAYEKAAKAYGARGENDPLRKSLDEDMKSAKVRLANLKKKFRPDQLAQLERAQNQIRSRPSSAQIFMPETLKLFLRLFQRIEDQLRLDQARHTL